MPVFDWFGHYRNRFGLKWHIVEIPYRIVDLEVLANFETILGVGSGRALFENLLSKNKSVIASDVSPALMHLAKKHGKNIKGFMACDVFSLPFKDQSFDCIYSQGLMEHFDETKATVILREMGRVAEYVVFSVPLHTYRGQPLEFEYHRKPEEWLKILSTVFRFRNALPYPTRKEAVFMASHKQLPKIKRLKTLEILKNAVSTS